MQMNELQHNKYKSEKNSEKSTRIEGLKRTFMPGFKVALYECSVIPQIFKGQGFCNRRWLY